MYYNHFLNLIHLILIIFFFKRLFFSVEFFFPSVSQKKNNSLDKKNWEKNVLLKCCFIHEKKVLRKKKSTGKFVFHWVSCVKVLLLPPGKKKPLERLSWQNLKILPVLRSWTQERNKQNEYKKNKWALKKNCFCSPIFFFIWLHTWKKTFPQKHFFFHAKKFVVKSFFLYFSHFFHKWTKKIFHSFSQMEKKSWEKEIYLVSHKLSWHFRFLFSFCFSFMWNFCFFLWKKIYFHTFTDEKKIRD